MYGVTLYIDNVPYHFEKYIPAKEELIRFKKKTKAMPCFQRAGFSTAWCRLLVRKDRAFNTKELNSPFTPSLIKRGLGSYTLRKNAKV